ncbi:MAG: hypothetical protein GY820_26705 [Gammaproteobacteria bacterium]|nr:hypothetical protein [Gammaproteobacteria bacterium]
MMKIGITPVAVGWVLLYLPTIKPGDDYKEASSEKFAGSKMSSWRLPREVTC